MNVNMLIIDKVSVLYKSKETIISRYIDLYDLYLHSIKSTQVDKEELLKCIKYKNIDLSKKSEFEVLVSENDRKFHEAVECFTKANLIVNIKTVEEIGLSADIIINEVICVLDFLRRLLLTTKAFSENYELPESILYTSKILGRSANEIYGWTYPIAGGSITLVYTSCKARDGLVTSLRRFNFLENYNTIYDFLNSGLPTAERVICDYLSYPDELCAKLNDLSI